MHTPKRLTVGRSMRELCEILYGMGGTSPSQSALYMKLKFGPTKSGTHHSSNRHGHAVFSRCCRAGLMRRETGEGTRVRVILTDLGERVAVGRR